MAKGHFNDGMPNLSIEILDLISDGQTIFQLLCKYIVCSIKQLLELNYVCARFFIVINASIAF